MKKSYIQVRKWYNKNLKTYLKNGDVLLKNKLDKFLQYIPQKGKILDMGSGTGRDVRYFVDRDYTSIGIDNSKAMIGYARELNKGKFYLMNMMKLDFEDKFFSGIWASSSLLTHLTTEDIKKSLLEANRVLKNSGIIGLIAMKKGKDDMEQKNFVFNKFTKKEVSELLNDTGFTPMAISIFSAHKRNWFYILAIKDK